MRSKRDPEWYCWAKKEGCGTTFKLNDPAIVDQQTGRIPNPDLADVYNTVLKMAVKRAHVAAILFVTCASDVFTQDVEDMPEFSDESPRRAQQAQPQGPSIAYQDAAKAIGRARNREELESVGKTLRKVKAGESEKANLRELYKMRLEEIEELADSLIDGMEAREAEADARQPGEEG